MGSHGITAIHIASETPPQSKNQLQLGPQSNPNKLEPQSRKRKQNQARQNGRCRGSKTVPCSWPGCDRVFVKKSNMTSHLSIHTGERPFKCPFKGCSMSFRVKSSMKYHISNAKSGHAGAMLPSSSALSREGPSPSATLSDDALSLGNVDSLSQQIASSEMHSLTGQKGFQQEGFGSVVTSSVSRGTSKGVNSEDCSIPTFSEDCPSYASSEKGIPVSESLAPVNFLLGTTATNEQPFQQLEQDISSLAGVQLLLSAIDQADQHIGLCLGPPLNELCQLPEPLLPEQTTSPSKWSNINIEGIRESLLL